MALDYHDIPGTDDWFIVECMKKLGNGFPRMHKLTRYRDGDAVVPLDAGESTRESYIRWVHRSRLHIVETIRDARTTRQRVIGFRTAAAGDEAGDASAWTHWKRSNMEVQSRDLFNNVADYGNGFLIVAGATQPDLGGTFRMPAMVTRDAWNTATMQSVVAPWLSEAGVTISYDPIFQREVAILFRPGYVRLAVRPAKEPSLTRDGVAWSPNKDEWTWAHEPQRLNYTADASIVESSSADGFGVWEKHLDHVDRINEITLQQLALIIMQAFRQRGISGNLPEYYPEGHPEAGRKIDYDELFKAGPAALWLLPAESKMWESLLTDVTPIVNARRDEVKMLASLTGTPAYVFGGDAQNQTAEGATVAREQLQFLAGAMNERATTPLRLGVGLMFAADRDVERSDWWDIDPIWAAVGKASLSEKGAAASSAKQGGATQRYIDTEIFEMSPAEQEQAALDRVAESFLIDATNSASNSANEALNPQRASSAIGA